MTNAEKYQEIFGFKPAYVCPTFECSNCPIGVETCLKHDYRLIPIAKWWNQEYKGGAE